MTDARVPLYVTEESCNREIKIIHDSLTDKIQRIMKLEANVRSHEQQIGSLMERDNLACTRLRKLEQRGQWMSGTPEYVLTTTGERLDIRPKVEYISVDESKSKSYWLLEMNQDEVKYLGTYTNAEVALAGAAQAARWEVVILEVSQNMPMKSWRYWYDRDTKKWDVDPFLGPDHDVRYGDTL